MRFPNLFQVLADKLALQPVQRNGDLVLTSMTQAWKSFLHRSGKARGINSSYSGPAFPQAIRVPSEPGTLLTYFIVPRTLRPISLTLPWLTFLGDLSKLRRI